MEWWMSEGGRGNIKTLFSFSIQTILKWKDVLWNDENKKCVMIKMGIKRKVCVGMICGDGRVGQ
jgi:hypothetical protein